MPECFCPNCGHNIPLMNYCGNCGARIVRCNGCGALVANPDRYCGRCGHEYEQQEKPPQKESQSR